MREIKFEFWNEENKKMYSLKTIFDYEIGTGYIFIDNEVAYCKTKDRGKTFAIICFPKGKLRQYTGLKDAKGIEIYEGDIMKFLTHYPHDYQVRNPHRKQGRLFGPVVWEDGWLFSDKKERNGFEDELLYKDNAHEFEIVGNIYENPELLSLTPKE